MVGKTSVGNSQTVESQPIPKAPVATNRMTVPMIPGMIMGMFMGSEFAASPPKTPRSANEVARITEL